MIEVIDLTKNDNVSLNSSNQTLLLSYEFTVNMPPTPLGRPYFARGRIFNPSRIKLNEFIGLSNPYITEGPLEGSLKASIIFHIARPVSHLNRNRTAVRANAPQYPTSKPDLDNLVKFVLDALNKKAYQDDSQIVELLCKKLYADIGTEPRTCLSLTKVV